MSNLRARLDEHQVVLLCLLLALLRRHLPLIIQIGLVSNQDNDDIVPSLAPDIVYPFTCVLERLRIWYFSVSINPCYQSSPEKSCILEIS